MNESLTLVPALVTGMLLGAMFLRRPLVDGSQRRFIPTAGALVPRQPAAADEHDSDWILFCLGRPLGAAAAAASLGFIIARLDRDAAHRA